MIYGYIRVSTDKQTVENQRYEIIKFCERQVLAVEPVAGFSMNKFSIDPLNLSK